MTPAELGLPEAPWYGARRIGTHPGSGMWSVHRTIAESINVELGCSNARCDKELIIEVVAFRNMDDKGLFDSIYERIIAGPVKVVAEVTVRKVDG